MVAGEPLRRVGAPTPRLLRSPPLAKVQSHTASSALRQVLSVSPHLLPSLQRWQLLAPLLTHVWKEERGKSSARPYCVYGSILCIHYIAASASAILASRGAFSSFLYGVS